jgi:hypothetical protein
MAFSRAGSQTEETAGGTRESDAEPNRGLGRTLSHIVAHSALARTLYGEIREFQDVFNIKNKETRFKHP